MSLFNAIRQTNGGDGRALMVGLSWAFVPIVALSAYMAGNPLLVGAGISIAFALLGTIGLKWDAGAGKIVVALGVIGQAIAWTASLSGHPWQVDSHMLFFALMAMLVILVDVRALLAGCALIVVHHLSLSFVLPGLIYPGGRCWPMSRVH